MIFFHIENLLVRWRWCMLNIQTSLRDTNSPNKDTSAVIMDIFRLFPLGHRFQLLWKYYEAKKCNPWNVNADSGRLLKFLTRDYI